MSIKLADTLAPMGDFPAVESDNVDITIDGSPKSLQQAYEDGDLGAGGSSIQVDQMPAASATELGKVYQFIGASGTYQHNYFYECVSDGETPPTYSWEQKNVQPSNAQASQVSYDNTTSGMTADDVQEAIDEIHSGLGTAAGKDFTDNVRPNSHDLVESGSVYSAINNALSTIYVPRGALTCAELTSALLVEANVGNVYEMSDSGTTSALFINGAGKTISVGDNVGIIKAGADTYLFNYMGNAFDLTDYQKKELTTSVLGETTVEDALGAIESKDKRIYIGHKSDWDLLSTAEKTEYDEAHFDDDNSATELPPDVYSTTEIKTNKVWIDGKPIYRKVIETGNLPNSTEAIISTGITNAVTLVHLWGAIQNDNCLPLPYVNTDGNHIQIWLGGSMDVLHIRTNSEVWINYTGYVVIEYTKTIDG